MSQRRHESASQNQPVEASASSTPPPLPEVVSMNVLPVNQTPPEASGEGTTWRFSESASNQVQFVQNSDD
ncbi:MAG: hypothetical protein KME32_32390 [Mojavia pulchra JT2-VF2]|jgi:hypothetical protein|uniref:Uncharacterized protein n=1 Tax=Mojavia pulchra JT2-VF2 TaxID=287848 RepID=A0A951UKQ7_9NOST|nr:hypothetical protein [Mojavia pulchra JT2-VF2]